MSREAQSETKVFDVEFWSHHIDIQKLREYAIAFEDERIRYAKSLINQPTISEKEIEKVKKRKVSEKVEIGIAHNLQEDEYAKLLEMRNESEAVVRELNPFMVSDYLAAPEGGKKRYQAAKRRVDTLTKSIRDMNDLLKQSDDRLPADFKFQGEVHFPTATGIKENPKRKSSF